MTTYRAEGMGGYGKIGFAVALIAGGFFGGNYLKGKYFPSEPLPDQTENGNGNENTE